MLGEVGTAERWFPGRELPQHPRPVLGCARDCSQRVERGEDTPRGTVGIRDPTVRPGVSAFRSPVMACWESKGQN